MSISRAKGLTVGVSEVISFIAEILAVQRTTSVLPSEPTRRLCCSFNPDRSRLTKNFEYYTNKRKKNY